MGDYLILNISTADKRDLQRVFICALILIICTILVIMDKVETSVLVGSIAGISGYYLGRFDSPERIEKKNGD